MGINCATVLRTTARFSTIHNNPEAVIRARAATCSTRAKPPDETSHRECKRAAAEHGWNHGSALRPARCHGTHRIRPGENALCSADAARLAHKLARNSGRGSRDNSFATFSPTRSPKSAVVRAQARAPIEQRVHVLIQFLNPGSHSWRIPHLIS